MFVKDALGTPTRARGEEGARKGRGGSGLQGGLREALCSLQGRL